VIIIITILLYLHFQKKESFEGITGASFVSRVPKGTIVAYYPPGGDLSKSPIPAGWALCNGGGNGTPDLRGRFIRMASDDLSEMGNGKGYSFADVKVSNENTKFYSGVAYTNFSSSEIGLYKFGEQGGSDRIRLDSADQLPSHSHWVGGLAIYGQSCGSNCSNIQGGGNGGAFGAVSGQTHLTGSSAYVPNVPPFYTLVFIMKL
jgi:hypothetical protein